MDIENITNYIRVSGRIATSGQPEASAFGAIAGAGYQLVVNLAMPDSDRAIAEEGSLVAAHRMIYVHIPVPFEAPTVDHLRSFLGVMESFAERKVWVHCAFNYRASAFLYQYARLVEGRTHQEALGVMLPSWTPNETWRTFLALTRTDLAPTPT